MRRLPCVFCVGAFALAGCFTPQRTPVVEVPRTETVQVVSHWKPVVLPALGSFRRAGEEPDGSVNYTVGSLRVRINGDRFEWAPSDLLSPIVASARTGSDQWLFATSDGVLVKSDSFVGPVTTVGHSTGEVLTSGYDSVGRVAVWSPSGRTYVGSPDEGLHVLSGTESLVDIGFVSPDFGLAATSPGRLMRTTNGGASFDPLNLQGEATEVIFPNANDFVVQTTRGLVRVGPSGDPVPYTGPTGRWDHTLTRETLIAALQDYTQHTPLGPLFRLANGFVPWGGGYASIDTPGGEDVLLLGTDGRERKVKAPGKECTLHEWGEDLLAACTDHDAFVLASMSPQDAAFSQFHSVARESASSLLLGIGGGTLLTFGSCTDSEAENVVCFYDGHDWHSIRIPEDAEIRGLAGNVLLLSQTLRVENGAPGERVEGWPTLLRLDGTMNRPEPLVPPSSLEFSSMQMLPDGRAIALGLKRDTRFLVSRALDHEAVLTALDLTVTDVAFADAQHGVAAGPQYSELWTTQDGGKSWQSLDIGVKGKTDHLEIESLDDDASDEPNRNAEPGPLRCFTRGCLVGKRLYWGNLHDAAANAVVSVIGPDKLVSQPSPSVREPPASLSNVLMCRPRPLSAAAYRRVVTGNPINPPVHSVTLPQGPAQWSPGVGGWLRWRFLNGTASGRLEASWMGHDRRGRFQTRAMVGNVPAPSMAVSSADPVLMIVRAMTRSSALVERCVGPREAAKCDLLVLASNAAPRVVPSYSSMLDTSDREDVLLVNASTLPGNGWLLHLGLVPRGQVFPRPLLPIDEIVQLNALGEVVHRRGFSWSRRIHQRAMAVDAHGAGMVVQSDDANNTLLFYSIDPADEAGHAIVIPAQRDIAGCTSPESVPTGVTRVYGQWPTAFSPRVAMPYGYRALPTSVIETNGTSVCLREGSYWPDAPTFDSWLDGLLQHTTGTASWMAGANGAVTGVIVGPTGSQTLECVTGR